MAISFIGILVLLVAFGGVIGVPILFLVALVKGRPGIAVGVLGSAFLLLVGVAFLAAIGLPIMAHMSQRTVADSAPNWAGGLVPLPPGYTDGGQVPLPPAGYTDSSQVAVNGMQVVRMPNGVGFSTWRVSFVHVFLLVGCGVALIAMIARRGLAHSAAGGHRLMWPALFATPLLLLFFFGSVRYQSSSQRAAENAAQANAMVQQQQAVLMSQQAALASRAAAQSKNLQDRAAKMDIPAQQAALMKQHEAMASQAAALSSNLQDRIAKMDIHELMDQFDAPRIALQAASSPTAAPAALALAAAAQQDLTPVKQPAVEAPSETTAKPPRDESSANTHKDRNSSKRKHPAQSPANSADRAVVKDTSSDATPDKPAGARPAWVDAPPKRTGDTRREVIATDEYESVDECYQAADIYLMLKAYERVQQIDDRPFTEGRLPSITFENNSIMADGACIATGRKHPEWQDSRMRYLNALGIGPDYLRTTIVARDPKNDESREYLDTVDRSFGPMKKLYMQVEFTPAIDRELTQHLQGFLRQSRLGMVGTMAASVLVLLGGVWGLLKLDTATKGYYTKRLFIGVPLGILGLFGVCVIYLVRAGFLH